MFVAGSTLNQCRMRTRQLQERMTRMERNGWEWRRWLALEYMVFATILFVILASLAHGAPYFPVDLEVTRAIQSIRTPALDLLMNLVGYPGLYPQVIPLNVFVIVILYL